MGPNVPFGIPFRLSSPLHLGGLLSPRWPKLRQTAQWSDPRNKKTLPSSKKRLSAVTADSLAGGRAGLEIGIGDLRRDGW